VRAAHALAAAELHLRASQTIVEQTLQGRQAWNNGVLVTAVDVELDRGDRVVSIAHAKISVRVRRIPAATSCRR
jgi:hypothetical protein